MNLDVLLGMQWGDEGKGKIVDVLAPHYDLIARFQGGPNAGHTLEFDGIKHVLHTIPSGIFREGVMNLIGNGVVINPVTLRKEVEALVSMGVDVKSKLMIAQKAHLILPTHRLLDKANEKAKGKAKIGSTLQGIGPTYMDKTGRNGFRVGDLQSKDWLAKFRKLKLKHDNLLTLLPEVENTFDEQEWLDAVLWLGAQNIVSGEDYVNSMLANDKRVLAEGAQGALLDVDFGTYPYVTSSNTIAAGACTGLGVAPNRIGHVYGIFKAYVTRVGSGPFPTRMNEKYENMIRDIGGEVGATTGRDRDCGWLDLPALRSVAMINGISHLSMMKSDVLSGVRALKVCTAYKMKDGSIMQTLPYNMEQIAEPIYTELDGWDENLRESFASMASSENFAKYVSFIQKELGMHINILSFGPDRGDTLFCEEFNKKEDFAYS